MNCDCLRSEERQPTPLWEMNSFRECGMYATQHRLARRPMMQGRHPFSPGWEMCFWIFIALFLQTSTFYTRIYTHTQHSLGSALSGSMSYPLVILLCVGLLHPTARAVLMDKLADNKICGDAECSCKSEHVHFILRIITLNKMLVFHCSFCPLYFLFLFCLLCMIRCSVHGHGLGWLHCSRLQIHQH